MTGEECLKALREKFPARTEEPAIVRPEWSVSSVPAPAPVGHFDGYRTYAEYIAESPWWRRVREDALDRANRRCQLCAAQGFLNVHHNNYDRIGRERPSDVIALCRDCHAQHHGKDGR